MRFEWDDAKAHANLAKHGVSFGEATEVFYDPNGLEDYDAEHSETESRFFIIGLSSIISARKADQVERQTYERTKNR